MGVRVKVKVKADPRADLCCLSVGGEKAGLKQQHWIGHFKGGVLFAFSPHFRVQTPTNIRVGTSRKPGRHLLAFNSSHKPQLQRTGRTHWLWISVRPQLIVLALNSKENTGLVMPHYGLHLNTDMHDAERVCVKVQANTACTGACFCLEV